MSILMKKWRCRKLAYNRRVQAGYATKTPPTSKWVAFMTAVHGGFPETCLRERCKLEKLTRVQAVLKYGDPRNWDWTPPEKLK